MRTSEIRQRWLDYFASRDHHIAEPVSLVSADPSILFTIAGMVPFIPYILGTEPAPWPRAANVQKCIRTNDIENVGLTTRHGTFFQMMGNFSFGDYFKEGAINYAWELLTGSIDDGFYGFDGDRLWVTLWEEDDESFDILTREIGMDPAQIVKLTREENFWDTGQPGPAGPCAEFHYDRGPEYGPDAVGGTVDPGGDRYLEIWNLVFDQYLRGEGTGKDYPLLRELDAKAIDTGAGLERIAFLLQGVGNMYETDLVFPVIETAGEISGRPYGVNDADDVRLRVVADHVRSALMLVGDGVRPSNEGRGYVLRRLIRRAVRSMRLLGVDEPVLPELLPVSRDAMATIYPEVATDFDRIAQIAYGEEEAFRRTLAAGTVILDTAVAKAKDLSPAAPRLAGSDAFALHDTYGFPIDLTLEMAAEHGVTVDEDEFRSLMAEQKERARADALAKKTGLTDAHVYQDIRDQLTGPVPFLGYTDTSAEVRIVAILVDGQPVPTVTAPAEVEVILDQTPFYAEMGGQLADTGTLSFSSGGVVDVADVQAPVQGVITHRGTLTEGSLHLDDAGVARIDTDRRHAIARAHTATHMVHKALHEHLGDQATQAGSENSPSRLRFDFRHGSAVPAGVLSDIEGRVNQRLAEDLSVNHEVMDIDAAQAAGAVALFGEKYGRNVRVVTIGGDWSIELCGGTHVPSTGHIGLVTVLGEASIGSGIRRVDALVGASAWSHQAKERALVSQLTHLVGARPEELPDRVSSLMSKLKAAEKELADVREQALLGSAAAVAASARPVGGIKLVTHDAGEATGDGARSLALDVRTRLGDAEPAVIAIGSVSGGRPVIVVTTNASARASGWRAGELVSIAAKTLGGGGGGKDDLAQGGGTDPNALAAAFAAVEAKVAGR